MYRADSSVNDGVALTSTAHPRAAWYKRLRFWVPPPRLSPDSLEIIELPDERLLNGISDYARKRANILNTVLGAQHYVQRTTMSDNEIETEIQAKGLTAPRVTLAHVEGCIAYEYYANAASLAGVAIVRLGPARAAVSRPVESMQCLTLCVLVLSNGFTVTGESACASPENFNAELGRKIAREKAIDKVWMLEGYLLKQRLYAEG